MKVLSALNLSPINLELFNFTLHTIIQIFHTGCVCDITPCQTFQALWHVIQGNVFVSCFTKEKNSLKSGPFFNKILEHSLI
jgi:hypothetical protein